MCISSDLAEFMETIVAAWEGEINGKVFHGLGYQNSAQNLKVHPTNPDRPGNSMVFAIPAKPGTLNETGFMDTTGIPHILEDMVVATMPATLGGSRGASFSVIAKSVSVFNVGIYTVFLSETPSLIEAEIEKALQDGRLAPEKAPEYQPELIKFFEEQNPGWPVAVFCFSNTTVQKSQPVVIIYDPLYLDYLYAPALDQHTGGAPDLKGMVDTDHHVIWGSPYIQGGKVEYQDELTETQELLLPTNVIGLPFNRKLKNGDFVTSVDSLRRGNPQYIRAQPSIWRSLT